MPEELWRTPDKRSETIFFIQNLSRSFRFTAPWRCFFSSVHLTHLLQGSGQRTETAMVKYSFCAQWPIFVFILMFVLDCLSWWKIQTRPIIRFLTEAVRFWFFICWYLIESMMPCIWTRCPGPPAEKQAHNIKDPAVYLTVDMGYFFIPVCTKLIWWVCCQKALFSVSSDHRSQCHLKFQSCLTTKFAGVCFWMSEDNVSWNPPEQHVVI